MGKRKPHFTRLRKSVMGLRMFSSVPVEEMDEAYIVRLRRWRLLLWSLAAVVFGSIMAIELQSMFSSGFMLLFGLAFTVLAVLFCSDAISQRIDAYESEKLWRKTDGGEK